MEIRTFQRATKTVSSVGGNPIDTVVRRASVVADDTRRGRKETGERKAMRIPVGGVLWKVRSNGARRTRALLALASALAFLLGYSEQPGLAFGVNYNARGFDTCAAPTQNAMDTWWTSSPYWTIGIYIGGSNRGCAQPNLTDAWITHTESGHGPYWWGLVPLWVGRQMPLACRNHPSNNYISLNTTTAYNQGHDEAVAAWAAANNLGMDMSYTPIVYDLEAYTANSGCNAAARAFINGWVDYLQLSPPQKAGLYTSDCGPNVDQFATIASPPDFIWFANWNNNKSTANAACLAANHWTGENRHKQYKGGHDETWGSKTIHVDNDCVYGPVYAKDIDVNNSECQ